MKVNTDDLLSLVSYVYLSFSIKNKKEITICSTDFNDLIDGEESSSDMSSNIGNIIE